MISVIKIPSPSSQANLCRKCSTFWSLLYIQFDRPRTIFDVDRECLYCGSACLSKCWLICGCNINFWIIHFQFIQTVLFTTFEFNFLICKLKKVEMRFGIFAIFNVIFGYKIGEQNITEMCSQTTMYVKSHSGRSNVEFPSWIPVARTPVNFLK